MSRLGLVAVCLLAFAVAGNVAAAPITVDWLRIVAGGKGAVVNDIVVRPDGMVAVAGEVQEGGIFGQPGVAKNDGFVAVFRPGGKLVWARVLGGDEQDRFVSIAAGAGNEVYLAGDSNSTSIGGQTAPGGRDAIVASYAANGDLAWVTRFGGDDNDLASSVAVQRRNGGTVVVAAGTTNSGTFEGHLTPALTDAFVAWFSAGGVLDGATVYGGSNGEIANGVAIGADGSAYLVGNTASGDAPGVTPTAGLSGVRAMLVKYRPDHTRAWTHFVGSGQETFADVAAGPGGIFVAGTTESASVEGQTSHGNNDIIVARYKPGGARVWLHLIGSPNFESGDGIALGPGDTVYVAGSMAEGNKGVTSPPGKLDTFAALYRLNATGVLQRRLLLNGDGSDYVNNVAVTPAGDAYLAGLTLSTTFAGKKTSPNDEDGFIARVH